MLNLLQLEIPQEFKQIEPKEFILNPTKEFKNEHDNNINYYEYKNLLIKNTNKFHVSKGAKAPVRSTLYSACYDISANLVLDKNIVVYLENNKKELREVSFGQIDNKNVNYINLKPKERVVVPTGLRVSMASNMSLRLHPRSGLSIKNGINLINCEGVIDSDYCQEIFIPIVNNSSEMFMIKNEDRICQCEFVEINERYNIISVEHDDSDLIKSSNRIGGFNSTGV